MQPLLGTPNSPFCIKPPKQAKSKPTTSFNNINPSSNYTPIETPFNPKTHKISLLKPIILFTPTSTMVSPSSSMTILFFFSLLSILSLSSISISTATATAAGKLNAYEALETFNFPRGLLPKGALSYNLDDKTGKFQANLNGSCSFSLEGSYQLSYKSKISGVISKNKLTNLSGISVKVFLLWLNIVEVRRVEDELEFSVGIASANFPVNNFYECPQCGCGLICNDDDKSQVRNIEKNPNPNPNSLASSI